MPLEAIIIGGQLWAQCDYFTDYADNSILIVAVHCYNWWTVLSSEEKSKTAFQNLFKLLKNNLIN